MSIGAILAIFFSVLLVLVFLGIPVFVSMGVTAIVGILLWLGPARLGQFGGIAYTQGTNFNQVILPMFILMSEFLSQGQIAEDIYYVLNRAIGKVKGGLAIATTLACTIFAALCGSSPATAASIGKISIAEMTKRGYAPGFAVGTVAAGGTLGIMIPPSITFCLYGVLTETSIVQLFMAGVIPGLILSALIIVSIIVRVRLNPNLINHVEAKSAADINMAEARDIVETAKDAATADSGAVKEKGASILTIIPALILIFVVLGTMYFGWATPLEAAGYGVIGSLLILILQRRFTMKIFSDSLLNAAKTGTMMVFLIICGFCMTFVISYLGVPQSIAVAITQSGLSKYAVLLLVYVVWFILGCLMDPTSLVILTIPFLFQTLTGFGFDPLWIGVVVVLAAQIAMITPPVGMNLFVLRANSDVPMKDIMTGCIPYVVLLFIGLAIFTIFPQLSLWLPAQMF